MDTSLKVDQGAEGQGNMIVRYKNKQGGSGPVYRYIGTPKSVYEGMEAAPSKGGFVWDRLRVRGSKSGHQYPYSLAGTGASDYVPRQAILAKRGRVGEMYVPRTFNGQKSQLPEASVRKGGDRPLPGYENRDSLTFKPSPPKPVTPKPPEPPKTALPVSPTKPVSPQSKISSLIKKVAEFFRGKPREFSRDEIEAFELMLGQR